MSETVTPKEFKVANDKGETWTRNEDRHEIIKKYLGPFVQGTSTTSNIVKILPRLDEVGLNVKLVAAVSYELFKMQPDSYQQQIVSESDWLNSTVITNASRRNMHDWLFSKISEKYAMSPDWDNRWRTGGSVEELCEEAHISPDWLFKGIEKFVKGSA